MTALADVLSILFKEDKSDTAKNRRVYSQTDD